MATNTLIQYLEAVDSSGTAYSTATSNRRQVETFIAAEGIVAKDAVSLDLSQAADGTKALKIVKAIIGTTTARCFIGVALNSASTGKNVDVVVQGICEANVDGATAAGSILQIGATGGRLGVRTVAVDEGGAATFNLYPVAGISAEADTGNIATICVFKQGI